MTLSEISLPVDYEWGASHALVFDAALAARLVEVQAEHGDPRHIPNARLLTDGRYMLTGDILRGCLPGGVFHGGFSNLDSNRFNEIQVMPLSESLALLPADPPPPTE